MTRSGSGERRPSTRSGRGRPFRIQERGGGWGREEDDDKAALGGVGEVTGTGRQCGGPTRWPRAATRGSVSGVEEASGGVR